MKVKGSAHRQIQCKRSQSQADGEGEHNCHEQEGCQKVSLQHARPCVSEAHVFFHTTEAKDQHSCTYFTLPVAHAMLCLSYLGGGHRYSAVPEPCCALSFCRKVMFLTLAAAVGLAAMALCQKDWSTCIQKIPGGFRHMSWHGVEIQPSVMGKL